MKKTRKYFSFFAILLMVIFAVGCVFMTACGNKDDNKDEEPVHTHSYTGDYVGDATGHWQLCADDGEKGPVSSHEYGEIVEKTPSTCKDAGTGTQTCTVCGYETEVELPLADHTWDSGVVTKEATCGDGETTYTCTVCGKTKTEPIQGTGAHTFEIADSETDIAWEWDESNITATATVKCAVCGSDVAIDATVDSGTETGDGEMVYTATVTINGTQYTDTHTVQASGAVELPITVDFSDPTSYSWINTTTAYKDDGVTAYEAVTESSDYPYGPLTLVTGSGMTIGKELENSLNTNGSGKSGDGRYFKLDVSEYVGKYLTIEAEFVSNSDDETRSLMVDTALYNSDTNVNASSTYLKRADSSSKSGEHVTLSCTKLIESSDDVLYIVSYKSVNIFNLSVSASDEAPAAEAFEGVALAGETAYIGEVAFNNDSALKIEPGTEENSYVVSGPASIMDATQAAAFNASDSRAGDAYVIVSVWGNEGDTVTFTNDREESKTVSFDEGADVLYVIFRVTDPATNSLKFEITANGGTETYAQYTVTFTGVTIGGVDEGLFAVNAEQNVALSSETDSVDVTVSVTYDGQPYESGNYDGYEVYIYSSDAGIANVTKEVTNGNITVSAAAVSGTATVTVAVVETSAYTTSIACATISVTVTGVGPDTTGMASESITFTAEQAASGSSITSDLTLVEGDDLTVVAKAKSDNDDGSKNDVAIDSSSKKDPEDETQYSYRLKTNGTVRSDSRNVTITTSGAAVIRFAIFSGSSGWSNIRTAQFYQYVDGTNDVLMYENDNVIGDGGYVVVWTVGVTEAGTYYFGSEKSSISVYAIDILYEAGTTVSVTYTFDSNGLVTTYSPEGIANGSEVTFSYGKSSYSVEQKSATYGGTTYTYGAKFEEYSTTNSSDVFTIVIPDAAKSASVTAVVHNEVMAYAYLSKTAGADSDAEGEIWKTGQYDSNNTCCIEAEGLASGTYYLYAGSLLSSWNAPASSSSTVTMYLCALTVTYRI